MDRVQLSRRASWLLGLLLVLSLANRLESQTPAQQPARLSVFYSLSDLGNDAELQGFALQALMSHLSSVQVNYFPPKQLLVVLGDAAVQAQAAAFLKEFRQALSAGPRAGRMRPDGQVVQASAAAPAVVRASEPLPLEVPSYAAPRPQQPKHLMHFIMGLGIRYEGEGLIDANVVEYAKAQAQSKDQPGSGAGSALQTVAAMAGPLSALAGQSVMPTPSSTVSPVPQGYAPAPMAASGLEPAPAVAPPTLPGPVTTMPPARD